MIRARIDPSSIFIGVTLYKVLQSTFMSGVGSLSDANGGLICERVSSPVLKKASLYHLFIDVLLQTVPAAMICMWGFSVHWTGGLVYLLTAQVMGLLVFGVGMSIAGPLNKIPDIQALVKYILMVGFYTSPTMIPMHKMEGIHYKINEYNPFSYFVEFVRFNSDIPTTFPDLQIHLLAVIILFMSTLTIIGLNRFDDLRWRMSSWS